MELARRFPDNESRASCQIVRSQKPVNVGLRDELATFVGESHSQFSWAQFWAHQGHVQHCLAHFVRDAVPDAARMA